MKNNKAVILIVVIITLIIATFIVYNNHFKDKEYKKTALNFYSKYFEIAESIESNDAELSLKKINNKQNQSNVKVLKSLLDLVRYEVPDNKYKYFSDMEKRFNRLKYLMEQSDIPWKDLSTDERMKIDSNFISVSLDLNTWNSGDKSIKWW